MNYANEPASVRLPKPTDKTPYRWHDGTMGVEMDIGPYQVCVRWDWLGAEPKGKTVAMLQVCRSDGSSVIDWRHLQEIKNHVCGWEWEAVEIYPAESRLKDPSNARYLWASKDPIPFGLSGGRMVLDSDHAFAPQRPLAAADNAGGG